MSSIGIKLLSLSTQPADSSRYRIHGFRLSDVEEIALIVDGQGLPARMPLRWVVQTRRSAVGSYATLLANLHGVLDLYRWAEATSSAPDDLDDFLASGGILSPSQLLQLGDWVLMQEVKLGFLSRFRKQGTVSQRIRSVVRFLEWGANVHGWGGSVHIPAAELNVYQNRLKETFRNQLTSPGSPRPEPLSPSQDQLLRELIRPKLGPGGSLLWPLRFPDTNPFSPKLQLRVWVCYLLMRDLGLRKGEVLKLTLEDLDAAMLKVRRRTNDPDPRNPIPKVKTRERALPIHDALRQAIRAYTSSNHEGRRRRGRYPFLITSSKGDPLSIAAFDDMWARARKASPEIGKLHPHVLRHTWAESFAVHLLKAEGEEKALQLLREAGGWSSRSKTPFHYIQNALSQKANAMLRQFNDRTYAEVSRNA